MCVFDDYDKWADFIDDSDKSEIATEKNYEIKIGVKEPYDDNEIAELNRIFADLRGKVIRFDFDKGIYSLECRFDVDEPPLSLIWESEYDLPLDIAKKILWLSVKNSADEAIDVIYPNPRVIEWYCKQNNTYGRRAFYSRIENRLLFCSYNLIMISIPGSIPDFIYRSVEYQKYIANLFSFEFLYRGYNDNPGGFERRYGSLFGGEVVHNDGEWTRHLQDAQGHSDDFTLWKIDKNKNASEVKDTAESVNHSDGDYFRIVRFEIKDLCSGRIRKIYLKFIWTPDGHKPKDCNVYAFIE